MIAFRRICLIMGFVGFAAILIPVLITFELHPVFSIIGFVLVGLCAVGFWVSKVVGGFVTTKEIIKTGIDIVKNNKPLFEQKKQEEEEPKPVTKTCPYCQTTYEGDTDCPNCGSSSVEK